MKELNYFQGADGKHYPFIEKDGLRIVARPVGVGVLDEAERFAAKGQVNIESLAVTESEGTMSLEIGPAGLPGYNISFPTELPVGDAYRKMLPWFPANFYASLNFEFENIAIIGMYLSSDGRIGFSTFPENAQIKRMLSGMANEKRLDEILNDRHFSEMLSKSYHLLLVSHDEEKPREGKIPFFWYSTKDAYEDETPFDRGVIINAEKFDITLFKAVSGISSFELTEKEFGWLNRLFEEKGIVYRHHLSGSN